MAGMDFVLVTPEQELANYLAHPRPRRGTGTGISRGYAVELAMRIIHARGEQPSPGRIQRELGEAVRNGGDLNGRDSKVYDRVMRDLGYIRVDLGYASRWRFGPKLRRVVGGIVP